MGIFDNVNSFNNAKQTSVLSADLTAPPLKPIIFKLIKKHMPSLIFTLFFSILSVLASLLVPVQIGKAVDYIIGKGDINFDGVLNVTITLLALIALSGVCFVASNAAQTLMTNAVIRDIRSQMFDAILRAPLSVLDNLPTGDLITRMSVDVEQIAYGLLQGINQIFTGFITIAITLILMLTINIPTALIVIVLTPMSLLLARFFAKRSHKSFLELSESRSKVGAATEENINNAKLIKLYGYEKRALIEFDKHNEEMFRSGFRSQYMTALVNPAARYINYIVYIAVALFGAYMVTSEHMSIGGLSVFLAYTNHFSKPFNEISGIMQELQSAAASSSRVFAFIHSKKEPDSPPDAVRVSSAKGEVNFEDVSFSYDKNKKIINGLNIRAHAGQKIALVGPTGCGKTTIINLLMRFYDIDSGEIIIDGVNIHNINRTDLRLLYGMMLQEAFLFSGTVRENIAYANSSATFEEIESAAKMAHCYNFISRLPQGFDTQINGGTTALSQGQKQLLCIARLMLVKPSMLILDEATSSIDTRLEKLIQRSFLKLTEGKTSWIVAHRLSTIRDCDRILVMDKGEIIESGTHEELIAKKGFYYSLYKS